MGVARNLPRGRTNGHPSWNCPKRWLWQRPRKANRYLFFSLRIGPAVHVFLSAGSRTRKNTLSTALRQIASECESAWFKHKNRRQSQAGREKKRTTQKGP